MKQGEPRGAFWTDAWRPLLLTLAIVQGYAGWRVNQARLMEDRRIRQVIERQADRASRSPTVPVFNSKRDPALGSLMPHLSVFNASGSEAHIPATGYRGAYVVWFVGPCAPCILDDLRRWQEKHGALAHVYVVSQSSAAEIRDFVATHNVNVPVLMDGNARERDALNVAWRPRAYVFDRSRKLRYIQPNWQSSEAARERIGNLLAELSHESAGARTAAAGVGRPKP